MLLRFGEYSCVKVSCPTSTPLLEFEGQARNESKIVKTPCMSAKAYCEEAFAQIHIHPTLGKLLSVNELGSRTSLITSEQCVPESCGIRQNLRICSRRHHDIMLV